MDEEQPDRRFADNVSRTGGSVFDDAVAAVFPDMMRRSVPGYPAIINMIQLLAEASVQLGSVLLDLRCSLGASTVALDLGGAGTQCRVIGVDNATAMLSRARAMLAGRHPRIEWVCADVHRERLGQAGFSRTDVWFQCSNFVSLVARK